MAKERNGWRPTPASHLPDIQKACVEHVHSGLWNSMDYDTKDVVSIDMKACYPAWVKRNPISSVSDTTTHDPHSNQWCSPWRHWHKLRRVPGMVVCSKLPPCHPCQVWKAFRRCLRWLVPDTTLGVPDGAWTAEVSKSGRRSSPSRSRPRSGCPMAGIRHAQLLASLRLKRRLVTDPGELNFLVHDTCQSRTLLSGSERCPLGHILTYFDGLQAQYTHLPVSMLAYAHINLLSMLSRFTQDEAVRVVTDSIYIQKAAIHKLKGVEAFVSRLRKACLLCLCAWGSVSPPGRLWPMVGQGRAVLHVPRVCGLSPQAGIQNICQYRAALRQPAVKAPLELPEQQRGQRQNHMSDRALPPKESACLDPDPPRNADSGHPGQDLSQLLPLEWPDRMDAQKDGAEVCPLGDNLGRCMHGTPPCSGNLPWLAWGSRHPGHLLWQPGAAAPDCQSNVTWLAPRACQLLWGGRGWPQSQRPGPESPQKGHRSATGQGSVPSDVESAARLPWVRKIHWSMEAREPYLDLATEGAQPSTRAAIPLP